MQIKAASQSSLSWGPSEEGLKIAFDDVETQVFHMTDPRNSTQILQKMKVDGRSRSRPGSGIN